MVTGWDLSLRYNDTKCCLSSVFFRFFFVDLSFSCFPSPSCFIVWRERWESRHTNPTPGSDLSSVTGGKKKSIHMLAVKNWKITKSLMVSLNVKISQHLSPPATLMQELNGASSQFYLVFQKNARSTINGGGVQGSGLYLPTIRHTWTSYMAVSTHRPFRSLPESIVEVLSIVSVSYPCLEAALLMIL